MNAAVKCGTYVLPLSKTCPQCGDTISQAELVVAPLFASSDEQQLSVTVECQGKKAMVFQIISSLEMVRLRADPSQKIAGIVADMVRDALHTLEPHDKKAFPVSGLADWYTPVLQRDGVEFMAMGQQPAPKPKLPKRKKAKWDF